MNPGKAARRMLTWLLGFAPRQERKAAIEDARQKRDLARAQARRATRTAGEIKRIAYEDNHFAANLIATLRSQGGGRSDPGEADH